MEENKYVGTVIWFSAVRGIGFVSWEIEGVKQKDMFVHFSDINADGYKSLFKDQKVSFNIGENKRGEQKAINVIVLKN